MHRQLIITCEHAGNKVPEEYQQLFQGQSEILASHRGWDPGAWPLAMDLAQTLNAPLFGCLTSRLLIETNRSLENEQLFSEFTSLLSTREKEKLINHIYHPYRNEVESAIEHAPKPVLHLSIHSFTPIWNYLERKTDIGILFDPDRKSESVFSQLLRDQLHQHLPEFHIHFNEPYKGTDDGFTTWLRKKYNDTEYTGIEIEVNQKFSATPLRIKEALARSIITIRSNYPSHIL
jgi:predicted N-formylglutamate amidohydrolase